MLARLGEGSGVLSLLGSSEDQGGDPAHRLGRAGLLAASGELGRASRLAEAVLQDREDGRALLLAAALADFQGDSKRADAFLARFALATPDALTRERALAEHYVRVDDLTTAEMHRKRVVELPAATVADWQELLACQVLLGRPDALETTLAQARGGIPSRRRPFRRVLTPRSSRSPPGGPEARELGASYVEGLARRSVAAEAIQVLAAAEGSMPSSADRTRLTALAQSAPTFLALQMALADVLIRRWELADAVAVCRAAAATFPTEAAPARVLASCLRAQGRVRKPPSRPGSGDPGPRACRCMRTCSWRSSRLRTGRGAPAALPSRGFRERARRGARDLRTGARGRGEDGSFPRRVRAAAPV